MIRSLLLTAASLLACSTPAAALSHLWAFTEIYSNADGSVQFIELHAELNAQGFLEGLGNTLSSNANPGFDPFGADLPETFMTAGRFMLLGTSGYAASPGAVAPDYLIPDGFFSPLGDTLVFEDDGTFGQGDTVVFGAMDLPTDGVDSLQIEDHVFSQGPNSPTNFAGETGSLPEPSAALLLIAAIAAAARRDRPRTA